MNSAPREALLRVESDDRRSAKAKKFDPRCVHEEFDGAGNGNSVEFAPGVVKAGDGVIEDFIGDRFGVVARIERRVDGMVAECQALHHAHLKFAKSVAAQGGAKTKHGRVADANVRADTSEAFVRKKGWVSQNRVGHF